MILKTEELMGDWFKGGMEKFLKRKYKEENHEVYKTFEEYLITLVEKLADTIFNERMVANSKAFLESDLFKNVFTKSKCSSAKEEADELFLKRMEGERKW